MKQLLLFLCALSVCGFASAQSYFPFPTDDASWKVIRCFIFYPPDGYDVFTYNQSGDTVIGANTYHKIYATTHHLPGSIYDTTYTVYYGAIREEQKKILFVGDYATGDNLERTLYDFNAEESCSIPFSSASGSFYFSSLRLTIFSGFCTSTPSDA